MSNPISVDQIKKALTTKGFSPDKGHDHDVYRYYYKGRKTAAKTKISRGSGYKTYNDSLFKLMISPLGLNNLRQVRDLLACPMSEEEYVRFLIETGFLKDE